MKIKQETIRRLADAESVLYDIIANRARARTSKPPSAFTWTRIKDRKREIRKATVLSLILVVGRQNGYQHAPALEDKNQLLDSARLAGNSFWPAIVKPFVCATISILRVRV